MCKSLVNRESSIESQISVVNPKIGVIVLQYIPCIIDIKSIIEKELRTLRASAISCKYILFVFLLHYTSFCLRFINVWWQCKKDKNLLSLGLGQQEQGKGLGSVGPLRVLACTTLGHAQPYRYLQPQFQMNNFNVQYQRILKKRKKSRRKSSQVYVRFMSNCVKKESIITHEKRK